MLVARYARIKQIPYLGICLGMQLAVIEFMRSVCGLTEADSQEFNINTSTPLFIIMPHHLDYELGGTLRLGDDQIDILPGSLANRIYNTTIITERHRHRYEFNNQYLDILEKHQVIVSGTTVKKKLVEIIEFKNHPFFVGCQFHPEFRSRPNKPHPLFLGFIKTTLAYHQKNY